MKSGHWFLGVLAAGIVTVIGSNETLAKKGGTDIFHFTADLTMQSEGVEGDANGSVEANIKKQGNARHQSLEISVGDLDPNATYELEAMIGGDANLTDVAEFETDDNGDARIVYTKVGQGNGSPKGDPLPNEPDPISDIRELVVMNVLTQAVLTADFTDPDKLQYLVKRGMTNDGEEEDAAASLRIKTNGSNAQLGIKATGLVPLGSYFLSIDEDILDLLQADNKGRLSIKGFPGGSPDVLDVVSISILNGSSNSVLSATLP